MKRRLDGRFNDIGKSAEDVTRGASCHWSEISKHRVHEVRWKTSQSPRLAAMPVAAKQSQFAVQPWSLHCIKARHIQAPVPNSSITPYTSGSSSNVSGGGGGLWSGGGIIL